MNQRAVRDRFKLLENTFIHTIHEYHDSSKVNDKKEKAEEMRQKCMETLCETNAKLDDESAKAKRTRGIGFLRPWCFLQREKKVKYYNIKSAKGRKVRTTPDDIASTVNVCRYDAGNESATSSFPTTAAAVNVCLNAVSTKLAIF